MQSARNSHARVLSYFRLILPHRRWNKSLSDEKQASLQDIMEIVNWNFMWHDFVFKVGVVASLRETESDHHLQYFDYGSPRLLSCSMDKYIPSSHKALVTFVHRARYMIHKKYKYQRYMSWSHQTDPYSIKMGNLFIGTCSEESIMRSDASRSIPRWLL